LHCLRIIRHIRCPGGHKNHTVKWVVISVEVRRDPIKPQDASDTKLGDFGLGFPISDLELALSTGQHLRRETFNANM
jgi:hypothetical protein